MPPALKMEESLEALQSLRNARWYSHWLVGHFSKYLSGEILEVGCGIGNFSRLLSQYGKILATDINKAYLQRIKRELRIQGSKDITVGFGDIEKKNFSFKPGRKFDSVVCLNVLEHLKNDHKALKNLYSILKPGGFLILLVPADNILYGEIDKAIFHYRRYGKFDLKKLVRSAGFQILSLKKLNFIGGLGWFFSGKILRNKTISNSKVSLFSKLAPFFLWFEKFIEPPIGTSLLLIARRGK